VAQNVPSFTLGLMAHLLDPGTRKGPGLKRSNPTLVQVEANELDLGFKSLVRLGLLLWLKKKRKV
jgi:hypothetical protein